MTLSLEKFAMMLKDRFLRSRKVESKVEAGTYRSTKVNPNTANQDSCSSRLVKCKMIQKKKGAVGENFISLVPIICVRS